MVCILFGNSEISSVVGSNQRYLTCLRHLVGSRTIVFFSQKRSIFHHACATEYDLLSNICTMSHDMFIIIAMMYFDATNFFYTHATSVADPDSGYGVHIQLKSEMI